MALGDCPPEDALLGKTAVGESLLIGVPLVASQWNRNRVLDAVLFGMLLKESVKKRFVSLPYREHPQRVNSSRTWVSMGIPSSATFVANADSWPLTGIARIEDRGERSFCFDAPKTALLD